MQSLPWDDLINRAENAGGGEPVPASPYLVEVKTAEAKTSSTGKPMIKVSSKIVGGPNDGRTLWDQYTVSVENDKALAIFFRHMAAYGLDKQYFASQPSWEQVAAALIGRRAIWDVTVGSYQGRPKNEVNDVKPAGAVPSAPQGVPVVPVQQVAPVPAPTAPQGYGQTSVPTPQVPQQPVPASPAPTPAPAPAPAPVDQGIPSPAKPPF